MTRAVSRSRVGARSSGRRREGRVRRFVGRVVETRGGRGVEMGAETLRLRESRRNQVEVVVPRFSGRKVEELRMRAGDQPPLL